MVFLLKNYNGELVEYFLSEEDINNIKVMILTKLCGDEVLYIFYNNSEKEKYDSIGLNKMRMYDGLDEINLITLEELSKLHKDEWF